MFYLKRSYRKQQDWLHAWDKQWGTSCINEKSKAMTFTSREAADAACERANRTCRGYNGAAKPQGMVFEVIEEI